MMKKQNIDFVVLWVNPNDEEWKKLRIKYAKKEKLLDTIDNREERYRDWGLFNYWFRGVEKFAPWVNKVHLVTCGHIPSWLNVKHPKLNIVKHSDFMPQNVLPTFNSNAIEVCIHKIPGLAENFVLFNDDMFITKSVKPEDFFRGGKPVNTMSFFANMPYAGNCDFYKVVSNNVAIINKHFNFQKFKKMNLSKCISLKQREWLFFTCPLLFYNQFVGFRNFHISISYSKNTFKEVWLKEADVLNKTMRNRFRNNEKDINHWLFNYWQFASGFFKQNNSHFGSSFFVNDKKVPNIISSQKYHILCINDVDCEGEYDAIRRKIIDSFDFILGDRSSFEV